MRFIKEYVREKLPVDYDSGVSGPLGFSGQLVLGETRVDLVTGSITNTGTGTISGFSGIGTGFSGISGYSGMFGGSGVSGFSGFSGTLSPSDQFLLNNLLSTGLTTGGRLSINGGDNTKFDIEDGFGYVVDTWTDPYNPTVARVEWSGLIGILDSYLSSPVTQVAIDKDGNVIQQTALFPNDNARDYIILGKTVHTSGVITVAVIAPRPTPSPKLAVNDLGLAIGTITINGCKYSPNGADLNLDRSDGTMYQVGANWNVSEKVPSVVSVSSATSLTFRYRYRDTVFGTYKNGPPTTTVDSNQYDDGTGTLAGVPAGKWTVQRIYLFTIGNTYLTYGQGVYDSLFEAQGSLQTENPDIDPNLSQDAALRCFLFVQQGATALNDPATASFLVTGKFGEASTVGPRGESGYSGVSGTLGESGASGLSGVSGFSGYSGTSGAIGPSGFSGLSGFSGTNALSYAGVVTVPSVTDNGDGSVTVGTGVYNFYATPNQVGDIRQRTVAGGTFTLYDQSTNMIIAYWNGGAPVLFLTASLDYVPGLGSWMLPISVFYREGTDVDEIGWTDYAHGMAEKLDARALMTRRFEREVSGGLILGETNIPIDRTVVVSGSYVWQGTDRRTVSDYNSNTDKIQFYYHVGGNWTRTTVLTGGQYNNTQYDDGTDLVGLTDDHYTVNWIYRSMTDDGLGGTEKEIAIVLGTTEYNTVAAAQASGAPPVPDILAQLFVLVGRITVQKNVNSGVVDSSFASTFVSSSPTTHNLLAGLQGGKPGEMYHLDYSGFSGYSGLVDRSRDMMSTGLLIGGLVTGTVGGTTFEVAAGTGIIVDNYTDPLNPTMKLVSWGDQSGIPLDYLLTDYQTAISIDINGNIVQTPEVNSDDERRTNIILGTIGHENNTDITWVTVEIVTGTDISNQFYDFIWNFRNWNIEGNDFSPNGTNLKIDKSEGKSFVAGANFQTERKAPHVVTSAAESPATYMYYYNTDAMGDWLAGVAVTDIDPDTYDTLTGTASVPSGKWTIQTVYYYPNLDSVDLQYGQVVYDDKHSALADIGVPITIDPSLEWDTFRAWLVVKQGATNLSDTDEAEFVSAGRLGLMSTAAGGGAGAGLTTAANVGISAFSGFSAIGLFKDKTGVTLNFKSLRAASPGVVITDNIALDTVDIDFTAGFSGYSGFSGTGESGFSGNSFSGFSGYSGVNALSYAGVIDAPTVTPTASGWVNIGTGTYNMFKTNDGSGDIIQVTIPGSSFELVDNDLNTIIAIYAGGYPMLFQQVGNATTDIFSDIVPIITFYRSGFDILQSSFGPYGLGLAERLHAKTLMTTRFEREIGGGLLLAETATPSARTVLVSGSIVWHGIARVTVDPYDSSTDPLHFYYHVGGNWTKSTTLSGGQYNNSQYDDGTSLQSLTGGNYTVNWIWRGMGDGDDSIAVVLGNAEYATVALAQASSVPTIPLDVSTMYILVGRIIVANGASSGLVESAFGTTFFGSTPTTHNNLAGLQGGSSTERYHITYEQWSGFSSYAESGASGTSGFSAVSGFSGFGESGASGYSGLGFSGFSGFSGLGANFDIVSDPFFLALG